MCIHDSNTYDIYIYMSYVFLCCVNIAHNHTAYIGCTWIHWMIDIFTYNDSSVYKLFEPFAKVAWGYRMWVVPTAPATLSVWHWVDLKGSKHVGLSLCSCLCNVSRWLSWHVKMWGTSQCWKWTLSDHCIFCLEVEKGKRNSQNTKKKNRTPPKFNSLPPKELTITRRENFSGANCWTSRVHSRNMSSTPKKAMGCSMKISHTSQTHRIHVWQFHLHLVDF